MRLKENEALVYLQDRGFDVKGRTYRKDKKKINDLKLQRLYHIAKAGFEDQHLERIDSLELIQKEMWDNYKKCDDPFKRVMILEKIMNVQPYLSSYYEATKEVIANPQTEASSVSDSTE